MSVTCDIIPKINKDGRMVESILFTNLLSSGLKRKDAISVYTKIFTSSFKREYGDWEYSPETYKGELDINGQPSIESIIELMPSFSSSSLQRESSTSREDSLNNSAKKIEGLSAAFAKIGITVDIKFDNTLDENANVVSTGKSSARITLNPNKVFEDTIPHEFGHIYVDILGYNHPIIQQGIDQLFGTELYAEIKKLYPELNEEQLNKEVLVTAIGREVASIFNNPSEIRKWNFWLNRLFRKIGELLGIHENAARTLAMDMINMQLRKGNGTISNYKQKQKATIDDIESKFAAEGLYLDEKEGVYKDKNGTIFKRLTEWVDESFTKLYKDMKKTPYERNADRLFKINGLDTTRDKISAKDENGLIREYTYPQLVEHEKMLQNTKGRIYGNIVHAIIQNKIKPDSKITDKIADWMAGTPGESYAQNPKDFEWIDGSIASIFAKSDINIFDRDISDARKDKLSPELIIASKIFGIATTIDNLIQHSDGNLSIIDWKTGGLFTDTFLATYMKYGRNQIENIRDTKLNRAKLEVVLRAMMVKESMGDKSVRFRNLKVVHMNKKGVTTVSNIDIIPFLGLIESYYKDSTNNKTEEYKQLKEKGLFDAKNYKGDNRDLESDLIDEIPNVAMQKLLSRLSQLNNERRDNKTPEELLDIDRRINYLTAEIGKLKAQTLNVDFEANSIEDMGWWKKTIGNPYSSHNPKLKAFFSFMFDRKDAARKRIEHLYKQHDDLLRPVIEQYYKKNGTKDFLRKSTKVLLGGINGLQYKELYDFMWEEVKDGDKNGLYARIITEENGTYKDSKGNTFTKEQYEYNKWYRETVASTYKKVSTKVAFYRGNKAITIAESMGNKPNELDAQFMPRYMINAEEITERYGFFSKENLGYQIDSVLSDFTEQEFGLNNTQYGIPIKYMGNDTIIQSQNHTLSTEIAFKNFITNVVMKDELDDVHNFGNGVINMLKATKDANNEDFSNTVEFLENHILLHVLDVKKPVKWSRKGFVIPYKGGTRTISIDRIMRLLKSWVSASAMWIKPVAAGSNAALIFTLNLSKAMVGSLAKATGMPIEQIDFTITDLIFAHKEHGKFIGDMMRGKKEENKLWLFAKQFNYLPDNYDYAVRKGELLGVKNKLFDKSNFYLFHSIGEEYGSFVLLAAQMKRYKMGTKSAWDSYDVQDGKLVYTGDRDLPLDDGTRLTELNATEITKLKRVSSRIHGGYRQDERTALELTAMGQWALQFKKYLPNVLENLFQGKYEDVSIGYYAKKQNDAGEDVYTWVSRINEGRVRVLGKWIMTMMYIRQDDDYAWSNLEDEQKLQIYDVMVSGAMWAMMTSATFLVLGDDDDDDEEEAAWRRRFVRLADDTTQGLYIPDLFNSIQTQIGILPKLYKTSSAAYDFLFRGIIMGEETQRGDMVGYNTLTNNLPFFATLKEYERYFGDDIIGTK